MHVRSPSELIKTIFHTHSSATTAMTPLLINSRLLVPLNTRGSNEQNAYVREGELAGAAKATGETWAPGDKLYWNDTNKNFTKTAGGNTLCGVAGSTQQSGDTTGVVIFDSYFTP